MSPRTARRARPGREHTGPRAGEHAERAAAILPTMPNRPLLLVVSTLVLVLALGAVYWMSHFGPRAHEPERVPPRPLPSLDRVAVWHGAAPLTADSLAGRPVALLLWSDTDPRALAALPVVDAWYRALAPLGARVVAVHEPEFAFASDTAVAGRITRALGLALPVADDSSALVEAAEGGMADGPHLVVADELGHVVVDTVGDLAAGGRALRAITARLHPEAPPLPEVDASLPAGAHTVWLGAGRVEEGPLRGIPAGHEQVFVAPLRYEATGGPWVPVPVGGWRTGTEGLAATRGGAANFVSIRYSASRAGVVLSPPPGGSARVWILRDDRWPDPSVRGEDVAGDAQGAFVRVTEPRIYWIDKGEGERVIQLSPDVPGVTVHAFVFTGARGTP